MNKNNYLIFGIILLGSLVLLTSYTAPSYSSINMTLCTGYTAPAYNQINFTLGDSDACASANCWSSFGTNTGSVFIPTGCAYSKLTGVSG
jgi:hypothetical protein